MRNGRDGVRDFRNSRVFEQEFEDDTLVIKAFHEGKGQLNPATTYHLKNLEDSVLAETKIVKATGRSLLELNLIQLVREMLTIKDADRPGIRGFCKETPHDKSVEFIIERQVFHSLLDELPLLAQDDLEFALFSPLRRLNEQLLSCLDVAGRLSIRRAVERNTVTIARKLALEPELPDLDVSDTEFLNSGPNANILWLLAATQVKHE
ncbi:hypothetical protein F5Y16DRAFT_401552 [Xylariaceae sp. FL0255]|nr:hypothetical protein F5Y16DRAFT_401552 [Xylariaceae sp. FL0255]